MSFEYFNAEITRQELGLGVLNINDRIHYQVSNEILGGTQSWHRHSVRSPYVDGEFTVNRARGRVEERFAVQVLGPDQLTLQENIRRLIDAVSQFRFQLRIELDEAPWVWQCETADYTIDFSQARMMARRALVSMNIPRSPKLIKGGW